MHSRIHSFLVLLFSSHLIIGQNASSDTLIVGYKISAPFVYKQNGELTGPTAWLWEEISDEYHLPFILVEKPLDSLLLGLSSGSIDLCISPLTITSERAKVMDFSPPYYIAHSSILSSALSTLERSMLFVRSFISLNFVRALGALAFVIFIFGIMVWLFERKGNKEEFGSGFKGLWSGFWWSAVTMTTVGYGDKSPKTLGGRVVALIWMFTAIIIISGFTASIASSLTVNRLNFTQNDIEDFKEKRLGTINDSSTETWLKNNFYTNTVAYPNLNSLTDALRKKEIDAIAYDRPILSDYIRVDTLKDLELLPLTFNAQFYAVGYNRSLPDTLKDIISTSILENTERMDWQVQLAEYGLEME